MLRNIATRALFRCLFSTQAIEAPKKYSETISKARAVMPLYSLTPNAVGNVFIAPNATVVGEVYMGKDISIGHGTVIRGDINAVLYLCYNLVCIKESSSAIIVSFTQLHLYQAVFLLA